jgi:hypothetical protein
LRVLLLTGEDDAGVGSVLHHVGGMELIEIRDIEAAQHTPLGRGKLEMSVIEQSQREARLAQENARLKTLVRELTLE